MRIHILGASGSGTSTLGHSLSENLQFRHFDSDDYYWKKTNPPFTEKNQIPERQRLMLSDMKELNDWVLSGSMDSWSDPFVPLFDLVIFLYVPAEARIQRIKQRETERHGSRILPGGDMYQAHLDFIEWARQYNEGVLTGRNLKRHDEWLKTLSCPVLKIEGDVTRDQSVSLALQKIAALK